MVSPNRRSGFTLLELMIVITIVGIAAAAAAPGVMSAMEDNRAANATTDVVRLGRRARMEPITSGRAFLIAYDAGGGPGRLRLFRGRNDRCNAQVWNLDNPVDQVDLLSYSPGWGGGQGIELQGTVDLCYEPNGAMLMRAAGSGGAFAWTAGGVVSGAIFTVRRLGAGVARQVVFPLGGSPRVRR